VDEYDLVLLEADTRDPGAFALLDRLRKVSIVPVMVLIPVTARGQGIHALELGADCFVLLPFDRRELVARSEALIRRYRSAF
jgi:two-component system response regulator CpxR